MLKLTINRKPHSFDVDEDTPLLWVLRDHAGLTGTKYACGIAACGACIVLVNGKPVHSCVTPGRTVQGQEITTIEGLAPDRAHPVQQAWIEEEVPQCGYCMSGQILSAVALLAAKPDPTDNDIDTALKDVLCRCGAYNRVRRAIKRAAARGKQ